MHYLLIKIQLLWAKHTKWLDRNPVKVPLRRRRTKTARKRRAIIARTTVCADLI